MFHISSAPIPENRIHAVWVLAFFHGFALPKFGRFPPAGMLNLTVARHTERPISAHMMTIFIPAVMIPVLADSSSSFVKFESARKFSVTHDR